MGNEVLDSGLPQRRRPSRKPKAPIKPEPPTADPRPKPIDLPDVSERSDLVIKVSEELLQQLIGQIGKVPGSPVSAETETDRPPAPPQKRPEVETSDSRVALLEARKKERRRLRSVDPVMFEVLPPESQRMVLSTLRLYQEYGIDVTFNAESDQFEARGKKDILEQGKIRTVDTLIRGKKVDHAVVADIGQNFLEFVRTNLPEELFSILYNSEVSILLMKDLEYRTADGQSSYRINGVSVVGSNQRQIAVRSNPYSLQRTPYAYAGTPETATYAMLHEVLHRWVDSGTLNEFKAKWPNKELSLGEEQELNDLALQFKDGNRFVHPPGYTDWQSYADHDEDMPQTMLNLLWDPKTELQRIKGDRVLEEKVRIAKVMLHHASQGLIDEGYWTVRIKGGDMQKYFSDRRLSQVSKGN